MVLDLTQPPLLLVAVHGTESNTTSPLVVVAVTNTYYNGALYHGGPSLGTLEDRAFPLL